MSESFFDRSTEIADRFIQSVLFVDDEIYSSKEDKIHNLDSSQLVRAFSKSKKLCALNNPRSEEDFRDIIEVSKKTDVTVLDWKMDLQKPDDDGDEEADVEEDDPRGSFTLKLIGEILSDDETSGTFKLILIYTGEVILNEIVDKVHTHFEDYKLEKLSDNSVGTQNVKIVIIGKPSLKGRLNHAENLKEWVVDYSKIPDYILFQFASMTDGLISNFALECLTIIRSNTFRILQLFNRNLDPAYLGHKILLPQVEDSEELLIDLMKDSLGDLLHYSQPERVLNSESINLWIKENLTSKKKPFLNKKSKPFKDENGVDKNVNYTLTEKLFNELIWSESLNVGVRFESAFKALDGYKKLNKNQRSEFLKSLQSKSTSIFVADKKDHEEVDLKFANLTHHKNLFKPNKLPPKLSLGVIVKGTINQSKYWVCIQQKCDSVRVGKGTVRKFLFLPLKPEPKESQNGFHFTSPDGQRLRLILKSYEIRTIKFTSNDETGSISAQKVGEKYFFKQIYSDGHDNHQPDVDEDFEWVFDLKDLHGQRISNDIAREISRVGLDESEWLRRSSI